MHAASSNLRAGTRARQMDYFPAFFDLAAQKVLVVGGGEVALRKVHAARARGRRQSRWSRREVRPNFTSARPPAAIKVAIREFVPEDLDGARLVIVATSRRAVNRWIASLERSARHSRQCGRRPRSLALHRSGHHRSRPGAGGRLDAAAPRRCWRAACASGWKRSFRSGSANSASWLQSSAPQPRGAIARQRRTAALFRTDSSTGAAARALRRRRRARRAAPRAAIARAIRGVRRGIRRGDAGGRRARGSGTADVEGAARAAGCRCHPARSSGAACRARYGAARRRAHLRGQGRRRRRQHAGADQRAARSSMHRRAGAWCG